MSEIAVLTGLDLVNVDMTKVRPDDLLRHSSSLLRRVLVLTDVAATSVSWLIVLAVLHPGGVAFAAQLAMIFGLTAITIGLVASQQLYLARICRVRTLEVSRLARVALIVGVGTYFAAGRLPLDIGVAEAFWGTVLPFAALTTSRSAYASWVRDRRSQGLSTQRIVIVGDNDEAVQLGRLLDGHPELGFIVSAMVDRSADVVSTLRRHDADSVLIAVSALETDALNALTRELLDARVHVHLSCGLAGIDYRRLRHTPMAHQPLFYLEPATSSEWQRVASRSLDIVGASVGLFLTLPVMAVAAIAIKLTDRGPVLFNQVRIGRNGEPFTLHKLRTMVPNAEAHLSVVAADNRRDGPLFKTDCDPRITRVGRLLRACSVDEIPQLWNVLKGTMSLVGPRPALPLEVAQFDDELLTRHRVRPGITGLWQVEARHDPSFEAYRRLDLFYLENWSLLSDLMILLATAKGLVGQARRDMRGQWKGATVRRTRSRRGVRRAQRTGAQHAVDHKRRVLIIVQNLPVPLDRRVWLECRALVSAGYGVSVICPKGPGDPAFETLEGVNLYKYTSPPQAEGLAGYLLEFVYCWLRTAALSVRVLRRDGFDVIQACNPPDTYWALALPYKLLGKRFVYDQHDLNPEVYASRFSRRSGLLYRGLLALERASYRTANHVISTNESYREVALRRGHKAPSNVSVVMSGPDADHMRRGASRPELRQGKDYLCVWLGVMGPQDGVELVLEAAACVRDKLGRDDVHFALLGFGDRLAALRELAEELGLDDLVTFTGRANPAMIHDYLSTADVGLTPDPLNPLNDVSTMNKTLEYMSFGVPVVAVDLKETRISAESAARYVPSDDPLAFAVAISDLLDSPTTASDMGRIGRQRIESSLSWQHQGPRYVEVYERVIGPGSPSRLRSMSASDAQ